MLYDRVLRDILEKKKNKESGKFNNIPFCFSRYKNYFDGFNPGEYTGLLGMTGSGKSRLVRFWMYHMIDFILQNDYPAKIVYFALEDQEIPVGKKMLSHYLYTRQQLSIGPQALNSRDNPISDTYINAIKKDELFYRKIYNIVEVVNHLSSPNQIEAKVGEVFKQYGKTHQIITIIDNQSNVTKDEQDDNEWAAIKRLSRDIIRLKFCKAGITTITVLQVDADTEKNTFRNAGKGSLINIEPNLSSVADAKVVARSMHNVFGLFDPWRFEIPAYPNSEGYNTKLMRGKFKALIHLKTNENEMGPRLGLYFDGLHEIFEQMPQLGDKDALNLMYEKIMREEQQKRLKANPTFWED